MPTPRTDVIVRHLRTLAAADAQRDLTDRELLRRFAAQRDEAAFAELVRRHGPMVLRVCRRVLSNRQDAEDAFQATFLVLARNAASNRWHASVANWLHGVACNLSRKVRDASVRRAFHEARAPASSSADPLADLSVREAQAILDEELSRLPEGLRAPLMLCHLEGLTRDEAARQLGWSVATLKRRLKCGKERLRAALSRRGLTLSAALCAAALGEGTVAAVGGPLAAATVTAALRFSVAGAGAAGLPARVAELAAGVGGWAGGAWLKTLAGLCLALGLALAGVHLAAPRDGAADPPPAPDKPAKPPAAAARLDLHGDPLPPGALVRLGTVRFRHSGPVLGGAFSPDGRLVATAGGPGDNQVHLWDAATGKEVRRLEGHPWRVNAVAFSPDGKTVASAGATVRLWDTATGKRLAEFHSHDNEVKALAFSPDGKLLASTGMNPERHGPAGARIEDKPSAIYLWDPTTGKQVHKLEGHEGDAAAIAFAPDGKTLASGGHDGTVRLWEMATGKERGKLTGHQRAVVSLSFAPDGRLLATAGWWGDGTVRLWAPGTGKLVRQFKEHAKRLAAVGFAPDGKTLATGGDDGIVRLWEAATGKERGRFLGPQEDVNWVAFSPDGKFLAASGAPDHALYVWPLDPHPVAERLPRSGATPEKKGPRQQRPVCCVAFSPDGKRLATVGGDCGENVHLWDAETGEALRRFGEGRGLCNSAAFSPDGKVLAGGCADGVVRFWNVHTGKEVRRLAGHEDAIRCVAFSPDGSRLASGCQDRTARVWDIATGKQLHRLGDRKGEGPVFAVAFSPDGKILATGGSSNAGQDDTLALWDVGTGKEVRRLRGHRGRVDAAAFSPDGRLLASWGSWNLKIRLWETATGKEVLQFRDEAPCSSATVADGRALAFSHDGKTLAVGGYNDAALQLWDVGTGRLRGRLLGHQGRVGPVAFSPDGRRLASGSADTTVLIWDVATLPGVGGPRR